MLKDDVLDTLGFASEFGLSISKSWEKVADLFPTDTEEHRAKRDAIYSFVMSQQDAAFQAQALRDFLSS